MKYILLCIMLITLCGCAIHGNAKCEDKYERQALALRSLADENIKLYEENVVLKRALRERPKPEPVIGVDR